MRPGYQSTVVGLIPHDWRVDTLESVCTRDGLVRGPFGGTLKKEFFVDQGYKVYEQRNAIYATIEAGSYYIDAEKFRELARFSLKPGDFIVSCSGTIGRVFQIPEGAPQGVINQALLKITVDHTAIDDRFFEAIFRSDAFQARIIDNSHGGAMQNLVGMPIFRNIPIQIPPRQEQEAIAEALGDVDGLLAGLERLIAKKRAVKTAVMQELLTGRRRLPGFFGRWVTRTFGECFEFLKTGSNSRRELSIEGDIEYLHYGDIHTKWHLVLDCDRETLPRIDKSKVDRLPFLQDGDLILADASEDYEGIGVGVEIKNVGERKIVAGLHTLLLRADKGVLADGFKAYLTSMKPVKNALQQIATGISVYGISKTNLRGVEIPMPPTIEEQNAIAVLLSDIDAEITALEARRAKTQAIKQGMMQELLTGRTRLV